MSRSSSSNNASKQNSSSQATKKQTKGSVNQMKYEIADEFGVELGANATAKENGQVGGEITKRLVKLGQNQLSGNYTQNK